MNSQCPYTREADTLMSNFNREIDATVATYLQVEECFARYSGWDFNGRVWWDRDTNLWKCEVWTWGRPKEVVSSDTLENIMTEVSDKYGYD